MTKIATFIDWNGVNALATRSAGKFSVFVSGGLEVLSDPKQDKVYEAISTGLDKLYGVEIFENYNAKLNLMNDGLYFFESEVGAWSFYKIFNEKPVYASGVYAAIYSHINGFIDENT